MTEDRETCEQCGASCSAKAKRDGESEQAFRERQELARRLCRVKHKILVLSGKGGVGKSSVAAGLALALNARGKRVGLLDIDLHGPSIPVLLGIEGARVTGTKGSIDPVTTRSGLKVMSMGFLLPGRDDPVIWRGPLKYAMIKQFLKDVEWGDLDYLVVDSPPGTGDEPLSIGQLIEDADGVVLVTTPQAVALSDVRKSLNFSRKLNLPVLGVVENMSGFTCPHCGATTEIFKGGGGEVMAEDMGVPFLGRIPLDPMMVSAGDAGALASYLGTDAPAAAAFEKVVKRLVSHVEGAEGVPPIDGESESTGRARGAR